MDRSIQSLSQAFGKFAGKTLLNPNRITCDVDTVAEQIKEEAAQYGLEVRIEYPGQAFTMQYRSDRLRVGVENVNGTLKVRDFNIG